MVLTAPWSTPGWVGGGVVVCAYACGCVSVYARTPLNLNSALHLLLIAQMVWQNLAFDVFSICILKLLTHTDVKMWTSRNVIYVWFKKKEKGEVKVRLFVVFPVTNKKRTICFLFPPIPVICIFLAVIRSDMIYIGVCVPPPAFLVFFFLSLLTLEYHVCLFGFVCPGWTGLLLGFDPFLPSTCEITISLLNRCTLLLYLCSLHSFRHWYS